VNILDFELVAVSKTQMNVRFDLLADGRIEQLASLELQKAIDVNNLTFFLHGRRPLVEFDELQPYDLFCHLSDVWVLKYYSTSAFRLNGYILEADAIDNKMK